MWLYIRFHTMQFQTDKSVAQNHLYCFGHIALPGKFFSEQVSEVGVLEVAPKYLAEGNSPDNRSICISTDEKTSYGFIVGAQEIIGKLFRRFRWRNQPGVKSGACPVEDEKFLFIIQFR